MEASKIHHRRVDIKSKAMDVKIVKIIVAVMAVVMDSKIFF